MAGRAYYEATKDARAAYKAAYYIANREAIRARRAAHYAVNRAETRAQQAVYRTNPEIKKQVNARGRYNDAVRRALLHGRSVATDPFEVAQLFRAYEIAVERGLQVDHRVAISAPGSPGHRYANIELLTPEAHLMKTAGERFAKRVVRSLLRDEEPAVAIDETEWAQITPQEAPTDL